MLLVLLLTIVFTFNKAVGSRNMTGVELSFLEKGEFNQTNGEAIIEGGYCNCRYPICRER
jgi:hypothetical protein